MQQVLLKLLLVMLLCTEIMKLIPQLKVFVSVLIIKRRIIYIILAGLVRTLQAVNGSTWHETFLGLWKAALYVVQRVRTSFYIYIYIFLN